MGALYVKDEQTKVMADRLAARRGLTKAAAVKLALANELAKDEPSHSLRDAIAEFRRTSPLTYDPSIVIDKAFFDALYDDE